MSKRAEINQWVDDLVYWEGIKNWMYLDSANPANVTTGIGFLLSGAKSAARFPWEDSRGREANSRQIEAEFARIKALGQTYNHAGRAQRAAGFYWTPSTSLRFQEGFAKLEARRLLVVSFVPALEAIFPAFVDFPASGRAALVDMAWNLGPGKLERGYPKLVRACNMNDWSMAANECSRKNVGDRGGGMNRNDWTKNLMQHATREWLGRSHET